MKKRIFFIPLYFIAIIANAQYLSINSASTNTGNLSSNNQILELSGNKGILLPRVSLTNSTSASPLSQFTDGMMVFNIQTTNDVVTGPYISFNSKWNKFNNGLISWLPQNNLSLSSTSAPFYIATNYLNYNASSGLTLSNPTSGSSCFNFTFEGVTSNFNGGYYPPTPNNFLGKLDFNLVDGNFVQSYFNPFNLGWSVYQNGNTFDIGRINSYIINFNANNSKVKSPFINFRNPTYIQTLTTDKIYLNNGVIQTGGSIGITNTSNLGLYSCNQGNWIRMGTNQAPIKFFSDMDTNGGKGNNCNMTIESNGNVGIGSNFTPSNKLDVKGNIRSLTGGLFSELDTASGPFMNLNNTIKTTTGVKQNWRLRNAYNSQATSSNGLFFSSYDGSNQNAYDHMFLADNGNVGIGTNNPQQKLDVNGSIKVQNTSGTDFSTRNGNIVLGANSKTQATSAKLWYFSNYSYTNGLTLSAVSSTSNPIVTNGLTIDNSGKVAIGNSSLNSLSSQFTVLGNQNQTVTNYGYLNNSPTTTAGYIPTIQNNIGYSIWADNRIAAGEFNAFSDARIKNIKGKSNSKKDLLILKQIEITDYTKKDSIAEANTYKKVIAQQVEKVYPQAVHKTKGFIPNVYKSAQAVEGQIILKTDFKQGDKIKLILATGELEVNVTQVANDSFKIDKPITEKVFVFGKEVDDFRNVDYQAIAMLNVSATQEIANRLQKLDHQLIELEIKSEALLSRKDELFKKIKKLPVK